MIKMIRAARLRILPMDLIAFLLSLAIFAWASLGAFGSSGEPGLVTVQTDEGEYLYSFDSHGHYHFEGPLGITEVLVDAHGASVISSPCRDQICVAAGQLTHTGDWTACLPNRIFLRIQSADSDSPVDAGSF